MTATERRPLTDRQREVLRAIVTYWGKHGCSPTIRELCELIGVASTNGVAVHLRPLASKGWIVWEPGEAKARGVVVPELVEAARVAAGKYLEGLANG